MIRPTLLTIITTLSLTTWFAFSSAPASAQGELEGEGTFPVERFRLSMDRDGILDVESADVPRHKSYDFALWFGLADDPLIVYREMDGERVGSLVSQRIAGNLSGSVALWNRLQLGVDVPLILSQSADDVGALPTMNELSSFGFGDLRIVPKVQLLYAERHGVNLAIMPTLTLPSGANADYRGEDGVSFVPELALSRAHGAIRWAANVGYRARANSQLVNLEVQDELFAHLGAGYRFSENGGPPLELDLTLSLATAAASPLSSANQNHVEVLGGVVYDFAGPLLGILAGGIGLEQGFGTPDWRVVAGVRLSKRSPLDRDKDGLVDNVDECPTEPEDIDNFEDQDGCPDPDNDQDGVLDVADGAPMDPEDKDQYKDEDGVPDPDNDGDGILDVADQCPLEAETVNTYLDDDGCPDVIPDTDGDGMPDTTDQCPEEAEDMDAFEDDDGCPDVDNDNDKVLDVNDACINEPGVVENKGCPDTDRDGDTVVDRLDNCPDEPGSPENNGCKKKQLVVLSNKKIEILERVYFATNRDVIRRRSFKLLDNVADVLLAHPEIERIRVEGHTDAQGDDEYNMDLSQRRADAVVKYLIKKGVASERLIPKGFGETRFIDTNDTRTGRANNRRVEFNIVDDTDAVKDSAAPAATPTPAPMPPSEQ